MMMNGICIMLNCCNSKIAKCFTTWMRVAFFLHSQIVRSTVQQLHFFQIFCARMTISTLQVFQEEVPRAKARQQLREAQNNDASRGLGEETGWLCGGARFKIHLTHYFKYFIHPWRNNPNALQFIQLEPPKNIKKPSNNGDSIGNAPLEMSKSSHLLQLNNPAILISQGSCVGTSQQSSWIRCPAWRRDAVTPRPRASSPRRCSPTAMRWILTQPTMARAIPYGRSSLTTRDIFFKP